VPDYKNKIEILSAPGCKNCVKAFTLAETVVSELNDKSIALRLVNIVDELDYAVSLGLLATPGIAINGRLIFTSIPSKIDLKQAIQSESLNLT